MLHVPFKISIMHRSQMQIKKDKLQVYEEVVVMKIRSLWHVTNASVFQNEQINSQSSSQFTLEIKGRVKN